jgi:hypothetical protein
MGLTMADNPIGDIRGMAREMAKRSFVTESTARLLEQVLYEASEYHAQQIANLKAALQPFAIAAARYDCEPGAVIHDNVELWQNGARIDFITVGDLRRARELQA